LYRLLSSNEAVHRDAGTLFRRERKLHRTSNINEIGFERVMDVLTERDVSMKNGVESVNAILNSLAEGASSRTKAKFTIYMTHLWTTLLFSNVLLLAPPLQALWSLLLRLILLLTLLLWFCHRLWETACSIPVMTEPLP
jgi:hypothetical protein